MCQRALHPFFFGGGQKHVGRNSLIVAGCGFSRLDLEVLFAQRSGPFWQGIAQPRLDQSRGDLYPVKSGGDVADGGAAGELTAVWLAADRGNLGQSELKLVHDLPLSVSQRDHQGEIDAVDGGRIVDDLHAGEFARKRSTGIQL